MTMVERVARALCRQAVGGLGHLPADVVADYLDRNWRGHVILARAAIEAMEPTLPMLIAGSAAMVGPLTSSSSVWQAMIQAALNGADE